VRSFEIYQNFPNPFNPVTRIAFELLKADRLALTIYNSRGELVITLLHQAMNAGRHEATWNGLNCYGEIAASGVYFYELQIEKLRERKKMVLLR
jgi:flagellar hook assembly protein FlgD